KTYELYSWRGLELFSLAEKYVIATLTTASEPDIMFVENKTAQVEIGNVKASTTMYIYNFVDKMLPDAEIVLKIGFVALPPELTNYIILFSPLRDAAILVPLRVCKWHVRVPADVLLNSHR
ncbi:MAG: hypothetical protein QXG57_05960, partial [Thermofilaceae archaeon]